MHWQKISAYSSRIGVGASTGIGIVIAFAATISTTIALLIALIQEGLIFLGQHKHDNLMCWKRYLQYHLEFIPITF